MYLKGHKSISMFSSLIPILLLTTQLLTLKHSATVNREARVQAQEVGVINLTIFSHGDTGWGYLWAQPGRLDKKLMIHECWDRYKLITLSICIYAGNLHLEEKGMDIGSSSENCIQPCLPRHFLTRIRVLDEIHKFVSSHLAHRPNPLP